MSDFDAPLVIHGALLSTICRRHARRWALPALLTALALTAGALALLPQSFTASASIAVQEPSTVASPLALLAGQSTSKRYIGVIRSRWAAEQVERQVGLDRICGVTSEQAISLLMHGVKPEDNTTDGLFYISVSLRGPSLLAPHAAVRRGRIRRAAADAANAYVEALRLYYTDNDNTRESVLLRGADQELQNAQSRFDEASARLRSFGRDLHGEDATLLASADPSSSAGAAPPAGSQIGKIYDSLAEVDTQIHAAQAAQETARRMVGSQLADLSHLPSEDPLLTQARGRVTQDQTELANLEVQYGPDNPEVVVAQGRLKIDSDTLQRQAQGVAKALTTDQVQASSTLNSLQARRQTLEAQLAHAQQHLDVSRSLSAEFQRREADVSLCFEVLKTTMTEAAKVRLENASAQSRMSVVDQATPPASGQPGLLSVAAASVCLVLLLLSASIVREYGRESRLLDAAQPESSSLIVPKKAA